MTALVLSAYKQLRPAQKAYVDAYVSDVERQAEKRNEPISLSLHRAIPPEVMEASGGMLDSPIVRAAIAERISERAASEEFTWQRWLKEVQSLAFSNINNYVEIGEDGLAAVELTKTAPEYLAAVKSCETEEHGDPFSRGHKRKTKIVLHEKLPALKMMQEFYMQVMQYAPHLMQPSQSMTPTAAKAKTLPASTTIEQAANAYADLLG